MHNSFTTKEVGVCGAAPKWAALINDQLFPMARRELKARDIQDQAGVAKGLALVRVHGGTHDPVIRDEALVDLGSGNVFYTVPLCEAERQSDCDQPAKLAFVIDDAWAVTLTGRQTGQSLKRLLAIPDTVTICRDLEAPNDEEISDSEILLHSEGPVFTKCQASITVKINNQPVRFVRRDVTALEVKETAIKQAVKIDVGCVLYQSKPDGGLGPAIRDDEVLSLQQCDTFNCVAPDDNS